MGVRTDPAPDLVLAADWSKGREGRAVWVADVAGSSIGRLSWRGGSLDDLLEVAAARAATSRVLVAIDAAFGLTVAAWGEVVEAAAGEAPGSFPEWLVAQVAATLGAVVSDPGEWSPATPFLALPSDAGLNDFLGQVGEARLRRAVDGIAGAKVAFLTNLPGHVGAASQSAWVELLGLLEGRTWGFWPFDGPLDSIFKSHSVALAECYPAKMYRIAQPEAPLPRKSSCQSRAEWLVSLAASNWIQRLGVDLRDLIAAEVNENEFDACAMAVALFRLIREGRSLESPWDDPTCEGGILGLEAALATEAAN